MAMNREELQARIAKVDEKIEKINRRIEKWARGMTEEAKELCRKVLDVKRDTPQAKEVYANYRDFVNTHSDDPSCFNADYSKGPNISELYHAYCDLRDVQATKAKYEAQLSEINNFENEEKIPVLVEFLDKWEENAREYYTEDAKRYFELATKYNDELEKYLSTLDPEQVNRRKWKYEETFSRNYYSSIAPLTLELTGIKYKHEYPYPDRPYAYVRVPDYYKFNEEALDRILKDEKKAKYKDLVLRISAVVGDIQDVAGLHIAPTGQLNGTVIGNKATAHVETIGAGGYNIQRFHYRCLVHKIS